jgi:hypothetical protein
MVGGATRQASVYDDVWGDDDGDDAPGHPHGSQLELQREYDARHASFHAVGYRDGVAAAKEGALQAGFDAGWADGAVAGWSWGVARGSAGALRAFAAAHPGVAVTPKDSAVTPDQQAGLLAALGGSAALGLPTDVLPHLWRHVEACVTCGSSGQAGEDGGAVMHLSSSAETAQLVEGTRAKVRAAGEALRALGVDVQPWCQRPSSQRPADA